MRGNIDWLELRRKFFHITLGLVLSVLIYFDFLKPWMTISIIIIGLVISLIYQHFDIPIIHWFLKIFEREKLRKKAPGKGVIYLFAGVLLITVFFDKNIVLASLMIWTFGDSISAMIGKHYGKIKHPLNDTRLIEGTIVGIIFASIAASLFVNWIFATIAAIIAMSVESLDIRFYNDTIDDNFLVPVISACIIYFCLLF
jgi:dolichol kinase